MLCEDCNENEAEVLVTEVDSTGNLKEKHLCKTCATKKGYILQKQKPLTELFSDFLKEKPDKEEREISCSVCGMTWEEFKQRGRFGCADCYRQFGERAEKLISRIQGTTLHTGRKSTVNPDDSPIFRKMQAKKIRQELAKAIKAEEYEKAAKLRDDLKKFEERSE